MAMFVCYRPNFEVQLDFDQALRECRRMALWSSPYRDELGETPWKELSVFGSRLVDY